MATAFRAFGLSLVMVLSVWLSGCASGGATGQDEASSRKAAAGKVAQSRRARERSLQRQWQNRRFSELQAAYGKPQTMLNLAGGAGLRYAAIYRLDSASGCTDSFSLTGDKDPVIVAYNCQ